MGRGHHHRARAPLREPAARAVRWARRRLSYYRDPGRPEIHQAGCWVMFAASSAVRCMKALQARGVAATAWAAPGMPHARCDQVHTRPPLIWNWTRVPLDQPETVWLVASIVVTFCGQVIQSSATISSWIRAAISYASSPAARSRSRSSPPRAWLTAAGLRARIAVSELASALRSALTAPRARAMSRSVPLNWVPVEASGRILSSAVTALRTRCRPRYGPKWRTWAAGSARYATERPGAAGRVSILM